MAHHLQIEDTQKRIPPNGNTGHAGPWLQALRMHMVTARNLAVRFAFNHRLRPKRRRRFALPAQSISTLLQAIPKTTDGLDQIG